jgi:hypothetical protein
MDMEDDMGLFKPSCPLEKSYLQVYGIHAPKKWKAEDCAECEFFQDQKCSYKEIMASRERFIKRGRPVLVKKAAMDQPASIRINQEQEAVRLVEFTNEEIEEYWVLSREFDRQWEAGPAEKRQDILDSLDQWKIHLEKGDSPALAGRKVKEWLDQRDRFRQSSRGE